MNINMLHQLFINKQYSLLVEDEIYCPMCEVVHENNSNCQRND
jgi:hypothetical protein